MSSSMKSISARVTSRCGARTMSSASQINFQPTSARFGPGCSESSKNSVDVKEYETPIGKTELLVNLATERSNDEKAGTNLTHRNKREEQYAQAFEQNRAELKDVQLNADGTAEGVLDIKASPVSSTSPAAVSKDGEKMQGMKVRMSAPTMKHMMGVFGPFSTEKNGMGQQAKKA